MHNLKPCGDRILVQRISESDKTESGIILPDSAKRKNPYATVLAIGDKHTTCKVGDIIFLAQYSGIEIDDMYVILKEEDVLGVVIPE